MALAVLFDGCSHRRRNIYTTPSADCRADISALFSAAADIVAVFFFPLWLGSLLQREEVSPLISKACWKIRLSFYSQMISSGSQDRYFDLFICCCFVILPEVAVHSLPLDSRINTFWGRDGSAEPSSDLLTFPDISVSHFLEFIDCMLLYLLERLLLLSLFPAAFHFILSLYS